MEGTARGWSWDEQLDAEASFVDEDWISTLRFDLLTVVDEGRRVPLKVTGLAGVGSSRVVLFLESPEGEEVVYGFPRETWGLPSYLRELPPWLGSGAHYDPARLERKLDRLVGDPMLDRVVTPYAQLYRTIVHHLREWPPFDHLVFADDAGRLAMPFGVRLPGTRAKLSQLASASSSSEDTKAWATDTLAVLARVEVDEGLEPDQIHENPVYVWAAARLAGYLAEDPDRAVRLVGDRLSAAPERIDTFLWQAWALAHLLASFDVTDQLWPFFQSVRDDMKARGVRFQSG